MSAKCRECRDGDVDAPATVTVKGVRTLDDGRKVPYQGSLCDEHLEYIQGDDTEIREIHPIQDVAETACRITERLNKFESFAEHVIQGKLYRQLTLEERTACRNFIRSNGHLEPSAFAAKVNMWMVGDAVKPKHHSTMWALVLQSNPTPEFKRRDRRQS